MRNGGSSHSPARFAYPQFCANSSAPAWVNFTEVPDAGEELCLAHALNIVDEFARCSGSAMHREVILEELGRVERDVAEGERQLAEQEALLVAYAGTSRAYCVPSARSSKAPDSEGAGLRSRATSFDDVIDPVQSQNADEDQVDSHCEAHDPGRDHEEDPCSQGGDRKQWICRIQVHLEFIPDSRRPVRRTVRLPRWTSLREPCGPDSPAAFLSLPGGNQLIDRPEGTYSAGWQKNWLSKAGLFGWRLWEWPSSPP